MAAPKVGKSRVVLTLADHVARKHGPTVLFSLEMSAKATRRRHMAQLSGVSARKQRRGNLSPAEWERYSRAVADAAKIPLHIVGRNVRSLPEMRRVLREAEKRDGHVRSIIVDHAGFLAIDSVRRNETIHEKMDRSYRALLELGEEVQVPLHAVQHTNRDGYGKQQLTLANIRDGGNAEGHAHAIIAIYRPYSLGGADPYYQGANLSPNDEKEIGEFQVLASRDGEVGSIPMRYIGHRNLWLEDPERIHK